MARTVFSLPRVQVPQSLVGELRSRKPGGMAKREKKKEKNIAVCYTAPIQKEDTRGKAKTGENSRELYDSFVKNLDPGKFIHFSKLNMYHVTNEIAKRMLSDFQSHQKERPYSISRKYEMLSFGI